MKRIPLRLAALAVLAACMTSPKNVTAGPRDALEYVPGDNAIYNNTRETRFRLAGTVRVPAGTPVKAAMRQAIRAWEAKALTELGAEFARWKNAQGKVIRCDENRSSPYSCAATGIPGR